MRDGAHDTASFYAELPSFTEFEGIADLQNYRPAPDDWHVLIADIVSSTKAIETGQYKDVNMIGAACITAALNASEGTDIPYVFGGDGASMLIPDAVAPVVSEAMKRLQVFAFQQFGFELRVGLLPVADIRKLDADVLVGKLALSPGNHLAMFTGGGVALADNMIKEGNRSVTRLNGVDNDVVPDLTGLSCRWEPLKSVRGQMVSLLVTPLAPTFDARVATINSLLTALQNALSIRLDSLRPTSGENMILRWPPKGLRLEALVTKGTKSLLQRLAAIHTSAVIQKILDRFDLKMGSFDAPAYREELRQNTDFRRYDDTLRLVLDCSESQINAIRKVLEDYKAKGQIKFGLHQSSHALMTCLVFSIADHEHIHFVDGAEGGFTLAAKQMKSG